jgi:hypothetical protein
MMGAGKRKMLESYDLNEKGIKAVESIKASLELILADLQRHKLHPHYLEEAKRHVELASFYAVKGISQTREYWK